MNRLELSDLKTLLRECAGEEEGVDLDGDVIDVPFMELGYDSLAILQTAGYIERDHGITLDEDALEEADTPRAFLALVNGALSAARAVA
ncbi:MULTISPECIES: acyl carrier protein [unclassified Streptomyces]|uniref:acyl carrier protein n=1 Tax=unclassified Streptomyces TaxID=2593676 RepID=UPI002251F5F9|nr:MULTISPECIES: acyl carrier protein [unclassified Streptomyces]MCX4993176.1 acyl carrier protein [Streptomyces sp. NBC_00568]MCX5009386.1 acyl carrier protein [Streptomyces sp. NBC_00638]